MVDEDGKLIDGDQLLYVLATARQQNGSLTGPVVGTVMSNLGLEHALKARNIDFGAPVSVTAMSSRALRESGGIIGGETSGHMLVLDKTTTGDGLICALQVLAIMKQTGKPLSELVAGMPKYPQTMVNVRTEQRMDPDHRRESRLRWRLPRLNWPIRARGTAGIGHRTGDSGHGGRRGSGAGRSLAKRLAAVVADSRLSLKPQ